MDNLIGKKLDGLYEVRELIGSGGMANVYKAVMLGHNGPVPAGTVVAVKVLRQEYLSNRPKPSKSCQVSIPLSSIRPVP